MPSQLKQNYYSNGVLLDGTTVVIRSVSSDDDAGIEELLKNMSRDSLYFRFLTPINTLKKNIPAVCKTESQCHVLLLALLKERVIGLGEYFVLESQFKDGSVAELAFIVADEFQGHGVGTLLLHHLTTIAISNGVKEFRALIHPDNRKMLEVLEHSGHKLKSQDSIGAVDVQLSLV